MSVWKTMSFCQDVRFCSANLIEIFQGLLLTHCVNVSVTITLFKFCVPKILALASWDGTNFDEIKMC